MVVVVVVAAAAAVVIAIQRDLLTGCKMMKRHVKTESFDSASSAKCKKFKVSTRHRNSIRMKDVVVTGLLDCSGHECCQNTVEWLSFFCTKSKLVR